MEQATVGGGCRMVIEPGAIMATDGPMERFRA